MNVYFGDMEPLEMRDPELENRLRECKTDEEKDKIIMENVLLKLCILVIAVVLLIFVAVVMGAIIYLFE
jgi:hypothetical protein